MTQLMYDEFQPGAYAVERSVFSGKFKTHHTRHEGMSLDEQRLIVDRLVAHFGIEPIAIKRHGGRPSIASHASPEGRTVVMGALAGAAIVCHEVAHILDGRPNKKEGDGYWHGPSWQAQFVACVRVILGDWHGDRLEKAFAKFEADKTVNKARAAKKRGQRRSTLKSGPRVRSVPKSEITGKLRTRAVTGTGMTLSWGANEERILAARYSTNKGGYWIVSAYSKSEEFSRAWGAVGWDRLPYGDHPRVRALFTEKRFSTKVEALEWAVQKLGG